MAFSAFFAAPIAAVLSNKTAASAASRRLSLGRFNFVEFGSRRSSVFSPVKLTARSYGFSTTKPSSGVRVIAAMEPVVSGVEKAVVAPVVVVTGASRGIGRAIALALGKSGCKIIKGS